MALFNKEPEKVSSNIKKDSPTSISPAAAPSAPASTTPSARPNGPASGEARAYLDRGSKISGKISFEGPARIDGEVDGELNAKDSILVGETAVVTAHIRAASVVVAGKISGDITASQRIEIRPSAKVQGNLVAPVLVIHEGALFEGHCSMQSESVRDDRKVTVFPKEERLAQAAGGQKQA